MCCVDLLTWIWYFMVDAFCVAVLILLLVVGLDRFG